MNIPMIPYLRSLRKLKGLLSLLFFSITLMGLASCGNKALDLEKITQDLKTTIPTIQQVRVYTEDTDPNNALGKDGHYIAGAALWDTRTNYSEELTKDKGKWATDAGASIEVYRTTDEAKKRVEYLKKFTGNTLTNPGAFKQIDNVVIRASNRLKKSEQDELLNAIEQEIN